VRNARIRCRNSLGATGSDQPGEADGRQPCHIDVTARGGTAEATHSILMGTQLIRIVGSTDTVVLLAWDCTR
jgi:hypothetical protein